MKPEVNAHNLLLHLLAETGLIGTGLALGGLAGWAVRVARDSHRGIGSGRAWTIAIVGIELVHSAVEFPLWNAEFLGLAAIAGGMSDPRRHAFRSTALARVLLLGVAVSGGATLFSTIDVHERLHREAAPAGSQSIEKLRRSLLRPYVDTGIALSMPLTREQLQAKLEFNEAVMHRWPVAPIVQRQIVYLAMAGRDDESFELLRHMRDLEPETLDELRALVARIPLNVLPLISPLRTRIEQE
jgi:hypothetical protein